MMLVLASGAPFSLALLAVCVLGLVASFTGADGSDR